MACEDAHPGAELLDFAQFRNSSTQFLVYGYDGRSLPELRAREFGRLAGETGGGTGVGLAGRPWVGVGTRFLEPTCKELFAPGASGVTSFGEHLKSKDLEGRVHESASWTRLPEVPLAAPGLPATLAL